MVFARTNWGAYWSWDPQQVGVLGTLLTYAALFALRGATDDDIKSAISGRFMPFSAFWWLCSVLTFIARFCLQVRAFIPTRLSPKATRRLDFRCGSTCSVMYYC
jgi:ABC-type transport system involved in cytochrome c biogenesis permease subunit